MHGSEDFISKLIDLSFDINAEEITSQIKENRLNTWIYSWREEFRRCIEGLVNNFD